MHGENTIEISDIQPRQEKRERERTKYNQHTQCNINSLPKLLKGSDLSNMKTMFGKLVKEKEIQTKHKNKSKGL